MKKVIYIISILVIAGILGFFLYLGTPYDPERSAYLNVEPPDSVARTIYNSRAGHKTTFIKKSAETNGEYTLLEIELAPGKGNDPHYHEQFNETFTAISGTLGVELNGEKILLEEGDVVIAETGDEHTFFNPTEDTIRFEVKIEPGSPGFEKALYILYGIINDGLVDEKGIPTDLHHAAVFVALSDTRSHEIGPFMSWLISRLAGRAQRNGIEDELIERYYLGMTKDVAQEVMN
jgi:quercetin dioxygenase-like cupin family protein